MIRQVSIVTALYSLLAFSAIIACDPQPAYDDLKVADTEDSKRNNGR